MKAHLGEEGTEQFTITTRVDGKLIREQKVHDPFAHTTITHRIGRWGLLKMMIHPREIKFSVAIDGTDGAISTIMMLDPTDMQALTDHLNDPNTPKEVAGLAGYHQE